MRARLRIAFLFLAAACATRKADRDGAGARPLYEHVRLVRSESDGGAPGRWVAQASVRTFKHPGTGATATLVSMFHFGEPSYFRSVEVHLRDVDVVLAEGWRDEASGKPDDRELPEEGRWIARLYQLIERLLGLESQRDWEARVADRRWIPADMDWKDLLHELDTRKVELLEPKAKSHVERLEDLFAGTPTPEQIEEARTRIEDLIMSGISHGADPPGPELELQLRREEAMWRIVREHLASGKYRRAALVYGAWHTPALEKRLVGELGFRLEATCWHDAILFGKKP